MTTRSFGSNALFSVASWFIPAVALFFAVPITVRGLGANQFGLLARVGALTGYLSLMDMGLATAIVRYLSYYGALDEGRPMVDIVRFAFVWFLVAGLIGAVLLFLGAPWIVQGLLKVPRHLWPTAETVVRLTAFNFVVAMLLSVASVIPQGFLRYDIAGVMTAVFGSLNAIGPAVLVSLGHGLEAIVVFSIVCDAAALVLYCVFAVRLFRRVTLSSGPEWKTIRRSALTFAGFNAATRMHMAVAAQTCRLVVGIAGGTAAAAFYQVPNLVSSNLGSMLSKVGQVLFPTGADLMARQDHEGVNRLYFRVSRLLFVVNASASVSVCLFATPLLAYWVGPQYAHRGAVALVLFTIAGAVDACSLAPSNLRLSAGRAGVNLAFSASNSAVTLVAVYPLTVRYGISGTALAWLLGSFNVPFSLYYTHRWILGVSSREVWKRSYRPTVLGAGLVGVATYFLLVPFARSLVSTLLLAGVSVALSVVISGMLGAVSREDLATARRLAGAAFKLVDGRAT